MSASEGLKTFGAIDIGSNSLRLLIKRGEEVLARELQITRLGKGLAAGLKLRESDLAPSLGALTEYQKILKKFKVTRYRAIATAAIREAPAREEVMAFLSKSGLTIEVIEGDVEARLAFEGAMLDRRKAGWVLDIGGGSTELVTRINGELVGHSFKMGSVRLREHFLKDDPPKSGQMKALRKQVAGLLKKEGEFALGVPDRPLVGVAGTVTTVFQMLKGLPEFDPITVHRGIMRKDSLEKLLGKLMSLTIEERAQIPGLPEARADVIPAGLAILLEVMAYLGKTQVAVSCLDNLDALIIGLQREG